jgi:ABC-type glycerol-3-phosphate transport system substrate-binding protein
MKSTSRLIAILAVIALLLAACGPAAAPAPSASGSAAATSAASPTLTTAPVTITYWATPTFSAVTGYETQTKNAGDWEKLLAANYTKLHPNVTIDVQSIPFTDAQTKMVAAVNAGLPPDIYQDSDTRQTQWAKPGLIEDVSALVPDVWQRIDPQFQKIMTVNGIPYGILNYASPGGFLKVNQAIFKDAGATLPADGTWTFADFETALNKVAIAGKRWPLAVRMNNEQGDYDWLGYLWGFGCREFSSDLKKSNMSSPQCIQALQWLAGARTKGWLIPGTTTIQPADIDAAYYTTGQAAVAYGRSDLTRREDTLKSQGKVGVPIDSELYLFPRSGTQQQGLITFLGSMQVFKQNDAAKKAVVADFIRFMTQSATLTTEFLTGGSISPYKDVTTPGTDPHFLRVVDWYKKYGVFDWGATIPQFNKIRLARIPVLQSVVLGSTSPTDAAAQLDKLVNDILANP